ncbi:MAG TPA: hypothetical protein VMH04_14280 [Candidatus Solibacter sp.]|nr:hypothetical protein [Candidatus Solibacter sp.]
MTSNLALGSPNVPSPPVFARAHVLQASAALLAELKASFGDSQRALLRLDLAGIEHGTRDQWRLQRALQILWGVTEGGQDEGLRSGVDIGPDRADAAALRAAVLEVLQLGRVQAVLLARAQRSLRMISHRVAGPHANYQAPASPASATPAGNCMGPQETI